MYFNAFVRAVLSRLRIPLRNWSSLPSDAERGELWLRQTNPYLVSDEPTPQLLRLLTQLDIGTTVASLEDGRVPASQLPELLEQFIAAQTNLTIDPPAHVGEIRLWGGHPLRLPPKWLLCDGTLVAKATYPELFAVIGHTWGTPPSSASTQFFLPNFTGRMPVGIAPAQRWPTTTTTVHKIVIHNGGTGFINGVYTTTGLMTFGSAVQITPCQLRIVVTDNAIERIDVLQGGAYLGINRVFTSPEFDPTHESDTNVQLLNGPWKTSASAGLRYSIYVVPITAAGYTWGVRVTARGSGYVSDPEVVFSGGTLQGATARAIRSIHNDIIGIIVTNVGNNQPAGATVTITGGGGSGATAEIAYWPLQNMPGDMTGEQWRYQFLQEMPQHSHGYYTSTSHDKAVATSGHKFANPATSFLQTTTVPSGMTISYPVLPTTIGVSFMIRCKP